MYFRTFAVYRLRGIGETLVLSLLLGAVWVSLEMSTLYEPLVAEERRELRLGFIGPLSGDIAAYGQDERNAVQLALEDLETRKSLPGYKLSVIFEDGRCNGKDASVAAQKLINIDKVRIILGGCCSGETLAAAPIAERAKVILLSVFSSSADITKAGEFVFRMAPSDADGARKAAGLILGDGFRRAALITENTDYAAGVRGLFVSAVKSGGVEIVADETYNPNQSDFRSILLRIKQRDPEVLFLNPQGGISGGLLVRQVKELGWAVPLYGTFALSSDDAARAAGGRTQLNGIKFVDAPAVMSAAGRAFIERFKKRFPAPQSEFEVLLRYDSVFLIADAIRRVGMDTEKIRDYLYGIRDYQGLEYAFHFDRNGDVVGIPYVVKEVRDGEVRIVDGK